MSLIKLTANRVVGAFLKSIVPTRGIFRKSSSGGSEDEFTTRYESFFSRPNVDGWDIRQGMNDLMGYDCVPDPTIIIAALKACRRIDDYALSVRFLESVKNKCGNNDLIIWPYIVEEITPTLQELGCDIPEALGYDHPELHLKSVYDM